MHPNIFKHIHLTIVILYKIIDFGVVKCAQWEEFSVKEELRQGETIGKIVASKWLKNLNLQRVVYISLAQNPIKSYFKVNRETGTITVGHRLDRETICPGKQDETECTVTFKVSLSAKGGHNAIIGIRVKIADINDNNPVFAKSNYHISISESSRKGSEVPLPRATDSDGPAHCVTRYEMRPQGNSAEYFEVIQRQISGKRLQPYLKQKKALDREFIASYKFHLRAIDAGNNQGEVAVTISILDSNDNYPIFVGTPYRRNISECTEASQEILAVQATDKDEGKNSQIKYRISHIASQDIRDKFYMYTNQLFLSNQLDFETMPRKLSIPIEAVDGEDLSTMTEVEIWIMDCNDNDPKIRILLATGEPGSFVSLKENQLESRQIATIMVTDSDTGERGRITCHISDRDRFDLQSSRDSESLNPSEKGGQDQVFTLYKRQGVTFDRESTPRITLRIICTDHGDRPRQAQRELIIEISDENDNAPRFISLRNFSISENNNQGASIGFVKATDKDSGVNNNIVYEIIEDGIKEHFEINSRGELIALSRFDREEKDVYRFTVRATDKGKPPLSSNATITVVITDVNDCSPQYIGERDFYIPESNDKSMVWYTLGKLKASDNDKGYNGSVMFYLDQYSVKPLEVSRYYHLTQAGVLSVNGVLDRETTPIHRLNVTIKDRGFPQRTSSVQLTVTLLDLNDNSPVFVYPTSRDNTINLTRDTPVGSTLKVIKAKDADSGENASISYFLQENAVTKHFTLEKSGELLLNKAFDASSYINNLYTIQVIARDAGNVSRSSMARLKIVVLSNKITDVGRRDRMPSDERMGDPGEGNMLVLLSLAATVVFIFVIVLIAFGYIYLRGESLCCLLGRSHDQRYSGGSNVAVIKREPGIEGQLCHPSGDDSSCINSLLHASKTCYPLDLGNYGDTCYQMNDFRSKSATMQPSSNYYKQLYRPFHSGEEGAVTIDGHPKQPCSQTLSRSILRNKGDPGPGVNASQQLRFLGGDGESDPGCASGEIGDTYKSILSLSVDQLLEPGPLYTELDSNKPIREGTLDSLDSTYNTKTTRGPKSSTASALTTTRTPKVTSSFV